MSAVELVQPRPAVIVARDVEQLRKGDVEAFDTWLGEIEGLLPLHRFTDLYSRVYRWSNTRGLWTLTIDLREQRITLARGWTDGQGNPPSANRTSMWQLDDIAVPYVRSALTVLGAIGPGADW